MLLSSLLFIPILGIFLISSLDSYYLDSKASISQVALNYKKIALVTSIVNFIVSLVMFILFDFSSNQFQFVNYQYEYDLYGIYLGVDSISIYFILLTTIIFPIAIISNWNSITDNIKTYFILMLLLEVLLLACFLVLDILLFYIFFESILPPLFLLIGIFGSSNRVRASFYLFLYTFIQKCKRAKDRGSPKALVTKDIKETLYLAWLMPQGRVISLVFRYTYEKLVFIVDIWVIAVLNHPYFKFASKNIIKGVKEQRVDGSSIFRNLNIVRCTLVAGKPVFGVKIYSPSDNKSIINSIFKRSIVTKSSLNPWFVTGFVEAEGSFMLGFFKSDSYKLGYRTQAIFKISLHKKDYNLLSLIQDYFKVGTITNHGDNSLQYTVKSFKYLDIILDHFDKYPLLSQKCADYRLFKDAITLIKNKEHLSSKGIKKILGIRASMNLGLSDEFKLSFPDIQFVSRPLVGLELVSAEFFLIIFIF